MQETENAVVETPAVKINPQEIFAGESKNRNLYDLQAAKHKALLLQLIKQYADEHFFFACEDYHLIDPKSTIQLTHPVLKIENNYYVLEDRTKKKSADNAENLSEPQKFLCNEINSMYVVVAVFSKSIGSAIETLSISSEALLEMPLMTKAIKISEGFSLADAEDEYKNSQAAGMLAPKMTSFQLIFSEENVHIDNEAEPGLDTSGLDAYQEHASEYAFIVMRRVGQCDLFDFLDDVEQGLREFSHEDFCQLVSAILYACQGQIFEKGLVHGDLKHENLLLNLEPYFQCFVIDFGCSHRQEEINIAHKYLSDQYAAPELGVYDKEGKIIGRSLTPTSVATDIYALGKILEDIMQVFKKNPKNEQWLERDTEEAKKFKANYLLEIEELISRMLDKEIKNRPTPENLLAASPAVKKEFDTHVQHVEKLRTDYIKIVKETVQADYAEIVQEFNVKYEQTGFSKSENQTEFETAHEIYTAEVGQLNTAHVDLIETKIKDFASRGLSSAQKSQYNHSFSLMKEDFYKALQENKNTFERKKISIKQMDFSARTEQNQKKRALEQEAKKAAAKKLEQEKLQKLESIKTQIRVCFSLKPNAEKTQVIPQETAKARRGLLSFWSRSATRSETPAAAPTASQCALFVEKMGECKDIEAIQKLLDQFLWALNLDSEKPDDKPHPDKAFFDSVKNVVESKETDLVPKVIPM